MEPSEFMLPPGPARLESRFPDFAVHNPKPVRWWPYAFLPPPHVVLNTMFPTLQGWTEKSMWDKFVSAISVPSILLLVITLPVVETEIPDDCSDGNPVGAPERSSIGSTAAPVSIRPEAAIEPETEWQQYRRSTRSHSVRSSHLVSPALLSLDSPDHVQLAIPDVAVPGPMQVVKPNLGLPSESDSQVEDPSEWNRWLVALQIFTGPLFAVFIVWANWREDLQEPGKMLVRLVLYTLVVSLVLLAVLLLTTSPDRRPKYHFLLCFMGFIISIAWISTIAGEVVGVLKAFGVILGISEALLGLTIFAAGNSVGDLIADITVARLGYPVMAL
jgi:sodium/potassium/calcium exchanger 6